jgi:hypothetical protein
MLAVLCFQAHGLGSGLYARTPRMQLYLYSDHGARIDTTGSAKVRIYSTQFWADTTGHGLALLPGALPDGTWMWYSDTAPTEIYDVYWDSLGTVAKVGTNVMLWSSTLADTMIADSLTLGANVVRSGSIIDATIQNADLDSASISLRCMASASVDAAQIKSDAVTEAKLKAVNSATDEDILTYESTTGDFEWQTPAETGLLVTAAFDDSLDAQLPTRVRSGSRLFPMSSGEERFYVAGIDSGDVVVASWAPRNWTMPYCTGTGSRPMSIGAWCAKDDTIYVASGCSSGATYSGGDSCYNWVAVDVD